MAYWSPEQAQGLALRAVRTEALRRSMARYGASTPNHMLNKTMKVKQYYSEKVASIFDSLSDEERSLFRSVINAGFDENAARELFDEGVAEEKRLGVTDAPDFPGLHFIPSSLRDLTCFVQREVKDGLHRALRDLPSKLGTAHCVVVPARNGRILREGPYRIVFRLDAASDAVIVLGIAAWACNPMVKIWRYIDQLKAEDLLRTSELYFRRVDLLEDEYEATPTLGRYLDYQAASRRAFPGASESHPTMLEAYRRCTYACCWRMSPHESWLAWKHYCSKGGGCAVQTTWRKLVHLHTRLRDTDKVHFREVTYIDHRRDEFQYDGLGEEAFYKAPWFSDEREMRLAIFHGEYISVTEEALQANPALIPDCDRIKCDLSSLVESIVVNPFAGEDQKAALIKLIGEQQPALLPKLRDSQILTPPVGRPGM